MSQPPVSSSMPQNSQTAPLTDSDRFKAIFEAALEAYNKTTKQSLVNPNADEGLKKWLKPTIHVLYAFSATLGGSVGLIFSPAKVIFAGAGILLLATKDLNEDHDTLMEIFKQIENFFRRLDVYTEVPPTSAMKDIMVKIMVEVLGILAIVTKETKQSRVIDFSSEKFLKKLAGQTDMKDALKRLDKLTNEEAQMVIAQTLKITHATDTKLIVVSNKVDDVKRL
ncbi:hypothetical protein EI94DRAFT_1704543 [Lactarius quietus]|nr:hypothetical protein EI94DRAFT_1704543 [Lactarius quietus]